MSTTTTTTTLTRLSSIKECKSSLSTSSDKMKQISVIGFVSFAAVVHSHLYWVYSIIYIAYHKITPTDDNNNTPAIRWKSGKFQQTDITISNKKKKVHHHSRKKSLTNKPKSVIMPTLAPTKGTVVTITTSNTTSDALSQQQQQQKHRVPLLHAFRSFPSAKQQQESFNIHQLIKSQRKLPKRSRSTGQLLNKVALPALVEVETRLSEDSYSSGSGNDELSTTTHISKRDRAMGLLRSTFHRSNSTGVMVHKSSSSYSSLSEEENVVIIASAAAKKRKRDTIFGITRKFSGRNNNNNNITITMDENIVPAMATVTGSPAEDLKKHHQRTKLFRSLPSWKKEK